jgi:hypothetical protein
LTLGCRISMLCLLSIGGLCTNRTVYFGDGGPRWENLCDDSAWQQIALQNCGRFLPPNEYECYPSCSVGDWSCTTFCLVVMELTCTSGAHTCDVSGMVSSIGPRLDFCDQSCGLSRSAIIGISCAGSVVFFWVVFLIVWCCKRRKAAKAAPLASLDSKLSYTPLAAGSQYDYVTGNFGTTLDQPPQGFPQHGQTPQSPPPGDQLPYDVKPS